MDAVAPGFRTHIDDRVADAAGGGIKNIVGVGQAHGHGVDQDIAVVGSVEGTLAAHRRHADAVAVTADAGDDAGHQMPRLGMVRAAEAQ